MVTIAIDQLSTEEKLRMMESLWESLCANAGSVFAPEWHGELLSEREKAIGIGNDDFEDWESAKAALRNRDR